MLYIHEHIKNVLVSDIKKLSKQKTLQLLASCAILTKIAQDILLFKNLNSSGHYILKSDIIKEIAPELHLNKSFDIKNMLYQNRYFNKYLVRISRGYSFSQGRYKLSEYTITNKFKKIIEAIILNPKMNILCYNIKDLNKISYGLEEENKIYYKNTVYTNRNELSKNKTLSEIQKAFEALKNICIKRNLFNNFSKKIQTYKFIPEVFTKEKNNTVLRHKTIVSIERINECLYADNISIIDAIYLMKLKNKNINGSVCIEYYQTNFGRIYQIGSFLQNLSRDIRNKLLSDNYSEIDISSAIYSIIYNCGLENNYQGSMNNIKAYVESPKEIQQAILNNISNFDNTVTKDYIKQILTSIPYGSNIHPNYIKFDIASGTCNSVPVTTKGYTEKYLPLELVEIPFIQELAQETKELVKFIIECNTYKEKERVYIKNCIGKTMEITSGIGIGKKIAHIYQGLEFFILEKMYTTIVSGSEIKTDALGLCIHDGIYIKKNLTKQTFYDIIDKIKENIKQTLGYHLEFAIKEV